MVRLRGTQKKQVPISQNVPEHNSRFRRTPPPRPCGAHGCVRTTLKSTVSSAYCSNDACHLLGTQLDQIYGWEAPYTALLYTLLHVRARTKVGSEAQRAPSDAASPASPSGLPATLLPSGPSVAARRPALRLPWGSEQPLRPRGGRDLLGGGSGRPTRRRPSM